MKEMKLEKDLKKLTRLLTQYRKLPTTSNRAKLQKYLNNNVMFIVAWSKEHLDFLVANGFKIT